VLAARATPFYATVYDMNKLFANAATGILVCCALAVTGLAVRRELVVARPAPAAYNPVARSVSDWRSFVDGSRIGPADAPVTIVEFSDFQCPYCGTMAGRLRAIREANPGKVALVYRHFPLDYHPFAGPAAHASICAERQGRFEAYHDAVFAQQDSLHGEVWPALAKVATVPDLQLFGECMKDSEPAQRIERDLAAARKLGVTSTPSILVNGMLVTGDDLGAIEEYVARALKTRNPI
jgi:protein-disulfide isomerase